MKDSVSNFHSLKQKHHKHLLDMHALKRWTSGILQKYFLSWIQAQSSLTPDSTAKQAEGGQKKKPRDTGSRDIKDIYI